MATKEQLKRWASDHGFSPKNPTWRKKYGRLVMRWIEDGFVHEGMSNGDDDITISIAGFGKTRVSA